MVLVYGTVSVPPALVGQVSPHRPLEEALAAFTGDLAVVLAAAFVGTHHADEVPLHVAVLQVGGVPVGGLGHV